MRFIMYLNVIQVKIKHKTHEHTYVEHRLISFLASSLLNLRADQISIPFDIIKKKELENFRVFVFKYL